MKRGVRFLRAAGVVWILAAPCAGQAPPVLEAQPSQEIKLTVARSVVIDYPADVARISTSNPEVADAVAVSTREVLVNAKSAGLSTVIVWSRAGGRTLYSVAVEPNLEPVRKLLKETFPKDYIQAQAARDSLSLTGTVSAQAIAERAAALVIPYAKTVVNNLKVASAGPEKQIVLKVKFAELNRNASTAFGVNLLSPGVLNTIGITSTGQFSSAKPAELKSIIPGRNQGFESKFTISDVLNVFAFRPDLNLGAFIKALQTQGLLQILAEPNLVTTNGKDASFLVGGEFPVPIVQGGANAGAITILFKEFGIRLTFQPNVTEHRTIKMFVKPEVSTIDLSNSVIFSGFTIPALATRRMETNIELGAGQSFVIAGLIDDRVTESLSKIPGLAHIPILGVLFKSRQENKARTELIVMVTPEITMPVSAADVKLGAMPKQGLEPLLLSPQPGRAPAAGAAKNAAPRKGQ